MYKELLEGLEIPPLLLEKITQLEESEYFEFFDAAGLMALMSIIRYGIEDDWPVEIIDRLLFSPIVPSIEHIETFRQTHHAMYAEQSISMAETVHQSTEQFFTISSSMYAGKSTLASEVCGRLANLGYRVVPMVPFFMSDENNANHITLRGRPVQEGDKIGKDGFAQIEAIAYNPASFEEIIEGLGIKRDEKVVIHFDEFSFLPSEDILNFIQYITINYSNVKVLFVGLNTNALGVELAGYTAARQYVTEEFVCKSFVPNAIEAVDDTTMPTGTYTSRYVLLPNGLKVLDCGFLPIVVPKEFSNLVHYTPANYFQHMYEILKGIGQHELLDQVVNPNEAQSGIRQTLFDRLKPAPIEA